VSEGNRSQGSGDTSTGGHDDLGSNRTPGARAGTAREGHGFGLVLFAPALLVKIGVLARGACLLAEALMVRLGRAFPAAPCPARPWGLRRHPAGLPEVHACGGSARSWPPASGRST
jgi:hypothetical protein